MYPLNFGHLKKNLLNPPPPVLARGDCTGERVLFVDVVEEGGRFTVGVVGGRGFYGRYLCPKWLHTLQ